jgi:CHAT domain-containing protein
LLYSEGDKNLAARPRLNAEMFEAAQLAKGNITAQGIAEAAARLAAGNPKVADVLRQLQQEQRQFAALGRERDTLVSSSDPLRAERLKALDARIAAVQKQLAETESEAQEAAPLYRRTIEEPVTEAEVRALMQPAEALISIFVAPQGSYGFLLERNRAITYKIPLNQEQIAALVHHLRETVLPKLVNGEEELPDYDTRAAYRLYAALFGPVAGALRNKSQLILAPSGALLSFPLEALVTDPNVSVQNGDYRKVPWLVRRFALSFVPAPRTFVDLRRIKAGSPGTRPFIGFGDFIPPTDRQIAALFPPDRCGEDNRNLHFLGRLPGTRAEIMSIGRELGAQPGDIVRGAAFTKTHLTGMDLDQYRIIDLATHALLPSELGKCQTEPAILTSVPPAARSADAGFLRPADIEKLKLNTDVVVLSACDTAGPGNGGGESLTGLARAFFSAGTRGMLVTHWSTLDLAAMRLMTGTVGTAGMAGREDTAQALRAAQLRMIDSAGSGKAAPMLLSHPFAWAPFVLIGDGIRARAPGA